MHDQELDRLFVRFRKRGDVAALGAIFDATAPELLRVAMSLVREPAEADDLLQETFLTAIERARRYDAERRLVPWLAGILVLHARERRRLQRRELDPARLCPREASVPEAHALGRELEAELDRALAELSARERAVLEAYLRQGKGAAEIASETGAAPGAVRMQIHRGLDRLRRLLPAGLALGGAEGALGAQGLAAVRTEVLRAGAAAARLAPGAGSALDAARSAGLVLSKKLALVGALAALAAGLLVLWGSGERAGGEERAGLARAGAPARAGAERELGLEPLAPPPPPAGARSAAPSRAPSPAAVDRDHAGLRGRVVEHDGAPVPGLPVALLEVDEAELFPVSLGAPPEMRLLAASTVTGEDADGRCVLSLPSHAEPGLWLRVEHARHAPQGRALGGAASLEVALTAGARLVATLADPRLAEGPCLLQLEHRGSAERPEFHLPRLVGMPREGELVLERLPAGQCTWNLFRCPSGAEALALIDPERAPQHLAQGKLELRAGETFAFELAGRRAGASGPLAAISGSLRVDGRAVGDLQVRLVPLDEARDSFYARGQGGRFQLGDLPPGRYLLHLRRSVTGQGTTVLAQEELELAAGEQREFELDIQSFPVRLRVLTAEGDAAAGARVLVVAKEGGPFRADALVGKDGRASLELAHRGPCRVLASHSEEGLAQAELEPAEHGAGELSLTLARGVACAGAVRPEPPAGFDADEGTLLLSSEADPWIQATCPLAFEDGTAPFRLVGLPPGRYTATLWGGDVALGLGVELPEWGNAALELRFTGDELAPTR